MTTHQHQLDRQGEQAKREKRNKDIDLYGYAGAFRRDSVISYEKYEWMKENNKLGGKNNERRRQI
ncbi:MAG: hypothetical protein KAW56_14035 [Candidatus Marinimicrobia bacterium]|nr:hypothetical protein [Candidatus Neomarinimicrobiota bacterium]